MSLDNSKALDTSQAAAPEENARPNERRWPHMRVLVAVDDGETSRRAARVARDLFGEHADYWVVSVGDPDLVLWRDMPMAWGVPYPVMLMGGAEGEVFGDRADVGPHGLEETDNAERARETAQQVADDVALPDATPLGATGDPAAKIKHVADEHDVDVIVVGWHEASWWRRIVEPSVPKEVLRHVDRPVLVVP
ncbi:MAG TPA: universal stress protein [Ilumatobacteraceae bacterium]|nr:universal stress protein [Ilumatobacteraceae bacterium]HRB04858.1 universal stress protein [Ilumatobacteraceae bacterium]